MKTIDYIKGLANNDRKIIIEIYRDFFQKTKWFVLKNKGNEADAQDVFNLALMQLSARLSVKQFEVDSFEGYLFTMCKNLWRKELNKRAKLIVTNTEEIELTNISDNFAFGVLEQERFDLFQEKFKEIKQDCQTILSLFLNKVSGKEIKKKLGVSSETLVRQQIFRCKKLLTKIIKEDNRFNDLRYL